MNTEKTSENIFTYCILDNEDQLKTSHRRLRKNISKKPLQGQDKKELFRETKKVFIKIQNLHHIYYLANCLVNLFLS